MQFYGKEKQEKNPLNSSIFFIGKSKYLLSQPVDLFGYTLYSSYTNMPLCALLSSEVTYLAILESQVVPTFLPSIQSQFIWTAQKSKTENMHRLKTRTCFYCPPSRRHEGSPLILLFFSAWGSSLNIRRGVHLYCYHHPQMGDMTLYCTISTNHIVP